MFPSRTDLIAISLIILPHGSVGLIRHSSSNMKSRALSLFFFLFSVMSHLLLVQSVILNRPCGERSSNSIKTEARRAAVTILGGPHRDDTAAAEAMSPLVAADGQQRSPFFRMTSLSAAIVNPGGKTQRDHLPVSGGEKKEKICFHDNPSL